ncbi:2-amino-4-hydroxy-6-hydroxymethyldihydropteridine diphosphokinase [Jiulongibacter sp. NS-SX5]|uniref:2-amino-4-hydroxy-6- hydroxymethyldihydropteridine diphosphokinase n=1 Tax=Jiulongibacter sp. NS-SX5 TaxID=3463854 RepID=UPI004058C6F0
MNTVFLALGSNLDNRELALQNARESIEKEIGEIVKCSSIIETKAWGITDQPDYLNQVIQVNTKLWPLEVIRLALSIEDQIGRKRLQKWGSRLIDIDVLYFNDWHFDTPDLIIPHPFIQHRDFVLKPLTEIAPQFVHPIIQISNQMLLNSLKT